MPDNPKIIDLEIKMSHFERTIEELSDVIYKQQLLIEKLEKTLNSLLNRLQDESAGDNEIGPGNDKPPHY